MLRKAKIEDAQAIQNLICFYSEDGKMLFRSLEEIEQAISDFRVYEKSGEVIGICNLKYGWEKLVEIRSLGVDPRYHRRGIATQMIKDSINQALLNQSCDTVFVLTYAIPLFEKLGFKIIAVAFSVRDRVCSQSVVSCLPVHFFNQIILANYVTD